jgi:hypothetical protein
MEYYGILNHELAYSYGTTGSVASETINLSSVVPNSTITATAQGFFAHFDCEVSQATTNFTWDISDRSDQPTANSSICQFHSGYVSEICQPTYQACPSQVPVLYIGVPDVNAPLPDTDPCANAWRLAFAQFSYERNESAPLNSSLGWNVEVSNVSVVMCTPSYSIQPLNITLDVGNANDTVQVQTTNPATRKAELLDGFSIQNFSQVLSDQFLGVGTDVPYSSYYSAHMRILSL